MTILELVNMPERRAEAQRVQAELREKHGHRLAQHPAQANHLWGQAREQAALDQLTALEEGGAQQAGEIALHSRRVELYRQLAEGLAAQGSFAEAAMTAREGGDAARETEYAARRDALEHLGEPRCEHPEETTERSPTDAKGVTRKTRTEIERVFDGEKVIAFFRCGACRAISADVVT